MDIASPSLSSARLYHALKNSVNPSQPSSLHYHMDFKTGTLNPKSETLNLELPPRFNSIKRSVEGLLPLDDDISFAWEARGDEMLH